MPVLTTGVGSLTFSGAAALLGAETSGVAIDFTDMSCVVRDAVTPANNFTGSPNTWLTNFTPSTKWVLGANGLYSSGTALRCSYDTVGNPLGVLSESAATTLTTYSRSLESAAWTATNVFKTSDFGVDGVDNTSTYMYATAPNGTVMHTAITLASGLQRFAPFIKRVSGTGDLQWTLDGGVTWTSFVGITNTWKRIGVSQTLANPQVGFKIVNNGDTFKIDFANGETDLTGCGDTSPMASDATLFTRAADTISTGSMPSIRTVGTAMITFTTPQTVWVASTGIMGIDGSSRFVYTGGAGYYSEYDGIAINNYPVVDYSINVRTPMALSWPYNANVIYLAAKGVVTAPLAFNPAWGTGGVYLGSFSGNNQTCTISRVLLLPVDKTPAWLQMIAT